MKRIASILLFMISGLIPVEIDAQAGCDVDDSRDSLWIALVNQEQFYNYGLENIGSSPLYQSIAKVDHETKARLAKSEHPILALYAQHLSYLAALRDTVSWQGPKVDFNASIPFEIRKSQPTLGVDANAQAKLVRSGFSAQALDSLCRHPNAIVSVMAGRQLIRYGYASFIGRHITYWDQLPYSYHQQVGCYTDEGAAIDYVFNGVLTRKQKLELFDIYANDLLDLRTETPIKSEVIRHIPYTTDLQDVYEVLWRDGNHAMLSAYTKVGMVTRAFDSLYQLTSRHELLDEFLPDYAMVLMQLDTVQAIDLQKIKDVEERIRTADKHSPLSKLKSAFYATLAKDMDRFGDIIAMARRQGVIPSTITSDLFAWQPIPKATIKCSGETQ